MRAYGGSLRQGFPACPSCQRTSEPNRTRSRSGGPGGSCPRFLRIDNPAPPLLWPRVHAPWWVRRDLHPPLRLKRPVPRVSRGRTLGGSAGSRTLLSRLRGGCITWLCFGPSYSVFPSLSFHPITSRNKETRGAFPGPRVPVWSQYGSGILGHAPPPAILSLDSPMKSQHRSGGKGATLTVGRFRILFGPI